MAMAATSSAFSDVRLVVFDMAGTTVDDLVARLQVAVVKTAMINSILAAR